ncbi:hypothetical protein PHYPO_G00112350 [Pangasianodon hypophthalmus]|uniref:Actin-associated protein FAM107A n=1 Tax=Pangasianodon hypophthalmus TaxID=310915 RepID=A0A5N5L455_PANHP|nr:hypothetical protein PHYPO_G00112350 [Pangasianodon hypophthalmus]
MDQKLGAGVYPDSPPSRPRDVLVKSASAYADIQWEQPHQPEITYNDPLRCPRRNILPVASYAPHPDYAQGDDDLIKPKKLINPVKASKSHQELHRELLMNHKRGVENKPELQRQELLKRHKQLEELEQEQERQEECSRSAPEFIKVKENLRRTSLMSTGEKEV